MFLNCVYVVIALVLMIFFPFLVTAISWDVLSFSRHPLGTLARLVTLLSLVVLGWLAYSKNSVLLTFAFMMILVSTVLAFVLSHLGER